MPRLTHHHDRTPVPRRLLCVLVVVLQLAAPVFAQPAQPAGSVVVRRPVAVVNLDLTGNPDVRELAREIGKALDTHVALRPGGLLAALYEGLDDPDAEQLDRARGKLTEALTELANGNFGSAARAAKDGQSELWSVTPTQAVPVYSELAFVRGKALLGDSKLVEARASFALSQRLDPARTIDTAREPPDVVAVFAAAKSTVAPTGRIEVAVGESGSQVRGTVWIDGIEVGFVPNQYVVSAGLHVVWVTDRDRATSGLEREVASGQTATAIVPAVSAPLDLKLQRARQELARAPDDGARLVAMKQLAKVADVKDAIVLSLVGGKIVYRTWRSDDADRAAGFSPVREHKAKDPAAKVLDDLHPPPVEPDPPGVVFPIPVDTTRWYQKPSYWAGIAFGSSLLVVGAYVLITSLLPDTVEGPVGIGLSRPGDRLLR